MPHKAGTPLAAPGMCMQHGVNTFHRGIQAYPCQKGNRLSAHVHVMLCQ